MSGEKIKLLYTSETAAIEKRTFQEISTLNIWDGAKQIYPRKKILRRDALRISVAVIPSFNIKNVSFIFKILPPAYLHII